MKMNNQYIKELKGHSGCSLSLRDNEIWGQFVEKSAMPPYSSRLFKQYGKQKNFYHDSIKTPKIISCSSTDERYNEDHDFSFCMEYINGPTFAEYIEKNPIRDIEDKFYRILNWIKSNNNLEDSEASNFYWKMQSFEPGFLGEDEALLKKYIGDGCKVFTSYCHGDLTLENILIRGDNIYFIDFLDSKINCREMDIAKLLQDILLGWSWRDKPRFPLARCGALHEIIKAEISGKMYLNSLSILLLNLYRILPYANQKTKAWAESKIKLLRKKLNGK